MKAAGGMVDLGYWLDPRPDGVGHLPLRWTLDGPVPARVNGVALGGGLELVVGCDLAVAVDTAEFGFVGPRWAACRWAACRWTAASSRSPASCR